MARRAGSWRRGGVEVSQRLLTLSGLALKTRFEMAQCCAHDPQVVQKFAEYWGLCRKILPAMRARQLAGIRPGSRHDVARIFASVVILKE
jgi:hypothetical protein